MHDLALHSSGRASGAGDACLFGLSLCSGAGGLDLGLAIAIPGYRAVGHVERETYAAATPGASNGSQTAAGLLWGHAEATDADAPAVVLVRGPALVNRHEILLPQGATEAQITAAHASLATLGILLR